jgi:hypothetical protein
MQPFTPNSATIKRPSTKAKLVPDNKNEKAKSQELRANS